MTNKFYFLLLSAVLLAQYYQNSRAMAAAAAKDDSSSSFEESSETKDHACMCNLKELPPRLRLLINALRESEQLTLVATQKAAIIFNRVLRDTAVLSAPSAALKTHLDRFAQYTAEIRRMQTLSQSRNTLEDAAQLQKLFGDILCGTLKVAAECGVLMQQYNTSVVLVAPTMEDLLVRLLLEKNSFPLLVRRFDMDLDIFNTIFFEEMYKYLAARPPAETHENELKFIVWYKQFKAEPIIDNFYDFFGLYTEEDIRSAAKFLKI